MELDTYRLPNGETFSVAKGAPRDVVMDAFNKEIERVRGTLAQSTKETVNRKEGAPWALREFVGGGSNKPEDRLANIRRYYPEAIPYGDDNFLFYDRQTGQPTLYNENGLSMGDVASMAREGFATAGAGIGAALGAGGGLLTGPGAPAAAPAGAAVGAGLGGAIAGSAYDAMGVGLRGRQDSRDVLEKVGDAATETALGIAGQRVGEMLPGAIRGALTSSGPATAGTVQAGAQSLVRSGIPATAGMVTGNKTMQFAEKFLENSLGGGSRIAQRAEEAVMAGRRRVDDAVDTLSGGAGGSPEYAGQRLKAGARNAAERIAQRFDDEYTAVFDTIGRDTPVAVDGVRSALGSFKSGLAQAPKTQRDRYGAAIQKAENILADAQANGGQLSFDTLRQIRTDLGKALGVRPTWRREAVNAGPLEQVYAALTDDILKAAEGAGSDTAMRLRVLDRALRINRKVVEPALGKVIEAGTDADAYKFAVSGSNQSGERLAQLFRYMSPEERNATGAAVLARLGHARPGQQNAAGDAFSFSTFLTEWNKIAPSAKDVLFGNSNKALRVQLDGLAEAAQAARAMEATANTSRTASHMQAFDMLTGALGGATGLLMGGGTGGAGVGAAATVGATILAQRSVANLLTNPAFVRWLTPGIKMATTGNLNGLSQHLGRLTAVGFANPAIRADVERYRDEMNATLRPFLLEASRQPQSGR